MIRLVALLTLLACSHGASADQRPPLTCDRISDSGIRVGLGGSRGTVVYDNTQTAIGGYGYDLPYLDVVIADELQMTGGGVLDELAFSVFVYNNTSPLLGVDATVWIGDAADPLNWLYQLNAQPTFPGGLSPNQYAVVTFTGLAPLNYTLPQNVIIGVNYANPVGQTDGNIGQAAFGPPTVGSSADFILYGYPTGLPLTSWLWAPYSPNNNIYYKITVVGGAGAGDGDLNCDGVVNAFDIDAFVKCLTTGTPTPPCPDCQNADINDDGVINAFDIDPFVVCLTTGNC